MIFQETNEDLIIELQGLQKELDSLNKKASLVKKREVLMKEINDSKSEIKRLKKSEASEFGKTILRGFKGTGKQIGNILGNMYENQRTNKKPKEFYDILGFNPK